MVRADHPKVKRVCVCAYVRESLPVRNFSNSDLTNKKCYIALYRSPSQTSDN